MFRSGPPLRASGPNNPMREHQELPVTINSDTKESIVMQLKLRDELLNLEKVSYAMDHIELPEGGVDCSEGCTPYGFPPEMLKAVETLT